MPPAKNNIAAKAARIEARKSRPGSNRDVNRRIKERSRDIDKYLYKGRTRHVHTNNYKRHESRKATETLKQARNDEFKAHIGRKREERDMAMALAGMRKK